ncbi:MAG: gliding motility-associated C-terminal domain-containing protein [Flavobacteriales bacterium]|nr:gliding motility-associated C-terminal domain-containing protein [Flavobacteriales bacterium]
MKKLLLTLFSLFSLQLAIAQPTGFFVDVQQVWYGNVGATDFTGYITYDVYVCFTNSTDFLSAIYGLAQLPNNVFLEDDEDVSIQMNGCPCYENPVGAYLGNGINCGLQQFFPELLLDSFWTIGMECITDPGSVQLAATLPSTGALQAQGVCGSVMDDGAIFTTIDQPNGIAGSDLKVLIGRFTTCADDLTIDLCLQTFVNGNQSMQDYTCPDPFVYQNPCLANPMDTSPTVTEEILCADDLATVEFDVSGNGTVQYQLFSFNAIDTTQLLIQDSPVFTELAEGQYFISMIDSIGCRDTSEVFVLIAPDPLTVVIDQTADNLCGGDAIAQFCPEISGGLTPYLIQIVNPAGQTTTINDGECFSNLGCVNGSGDYTINISDAAGCSFSQDVTVSCPQVLAVNAVTSPIPCFGECSGEVDLTITGGTGDLTVDFTTPGFTQIVQPSPIDVTASDLCAGIYDLTVVDANGCQVLQSFDLQQPPLLTAIFQTTDVLCAGDCTGTVTFIGNGGVPAYTIEVTNAAGQLQNPNALCAGSYVATVIDQNDCEFSDNITINEPLAITFDITATDLSCFGADDGSICVSNAAGGTGLLEWQIASPPTASTPYTTNPCFENLGPEIYSINVTDGTCVITQNGVAIQEPGELIVSLAKTDISCFGLTDGQIEITCEGGTGVVSIIDPVAEACPYTMTDLIAGPYDITIQDETGCTDVASVTIVEPTQVTVSVLGTTDISCGGDCDGAANINFSGGTGELTLFLNDNQILPISLCADEYVALVIDENGCEASTTFEIIQPDPITFLFDIDQVTCTGMNDGSVNVFPIGGVGNLSWEIVEDVDINNLFEGPYTVVASDETGCIAEATFEVTAEIITDMLVSVFSSPVTCWDEGDGTATAVVTGGTPPIEYLWNDPQNQITATAVGLVEEVYSVTVTDAIGCTLSYLVEVEPTVGCFFIADIITPNGDGANDEWVIGGLEFFPSSTVQVFNRWGQILFESKGYSTRWDATYNGNVLPIADYYYIITFDPSRDPITGTVTIKY